MASPPIPSPQGINARWVLGILAFLGLGSIAVGIYFTRDDPTPTLYQHVDGTFSLNRKDGPNVTPKDFHHCLIGYESFGLVRLVCNPRTQIRDWYPFMRRGNWAGVSRYQIEFDGRLFTFSFTTADDELEGASKPPSTIINLRGAGKPAFEDRPPKSDVAILVNSSTTCEEALNAAWKHIGQGRSISIVSGFDHSDPGISFGQPLGWLHRNNEDGELSSTFTRPRSDFRNRYIQPTIDRLKAVF